MGDKILCEAEQTGVGFVELSEEDSCRYVKSGEPMDRAGAYRAQGLASIFMESLDGDFFNVIGLPLCRLSKMLKGLGVSIF